MTKSTNATSLDIPVASPVHSRSFKAEVRKEWIEDSAVDPEYYSLLVEEGLLAFHPYADVATAFKLPKTGTGFRWSIRGINPVTGEPMPSIAQVKANIKVNGDIKKYLSLPDSGSDVICLPLPSCFSSFKQAISETDSLCITEGAKKTAAINSQGYLAVSALGCQCFFTESKEGKARENLKHLTELVKELNATVYIFPDGDIATNENVLRGTATAYGKYTDAGINCKVIHDPKMKGKGIDDHLATIPEEERRQELERIMTQEYPIEKLKEQLEKQFSGKEEERPDNPVYIAQCFAEEHREVLRYDLSQQVFKQWEGRYWKAQPIEVIEKAAKAYALTGFTLKSSRKTKDIVENLRLDLLQQEWQSADRKVWINFSNGLYNTKERKFYEGEHKPELLLTSCLERENVPIEPNGKTVLELLQEYCPVFYRWAKQALNKDELVLKALAAINAIATFRFSELQLFLHTYGKPGTGKGTFNRLLLDLVGKGNYTSTRLHKLNNDYDIASLIDKQLVLCPDEDKMFGNFSGLKSLTGGDTVSGRHPYGKPFSSVFYGSIVVTANDSVFCGDTTGIDRRMVTLAFNNVISERDPLIEDALKEELSALTSVALWMSPEEVKALLTGKKDDPATKAEKWALIDDSVAYWMDECLIEHSKSYVPLSSFGDEDEYSGHSTLYSNYRDYCKENGHSPVNAETFGRRLRQHTEFLGWKIEKVRRTPSWGGATRVNCIQGVTLRSESEEFRRYPTISELLGAEPDDEDEVSGLSEDLSGLCQGSCQGKKPDNHAGCQGSQGESAKLLQNASEAIAEFFEGEQVEIYSESPVYPDNDAISTVSALTEEESVREWKYGDGFYVGQEVGKYDTKVPSRLRRKGHRLTGWRGYVREITDTCVQVWWVGDWQTKANGRLRLDTNRKPQEKWTRMKPEDLIDWAFANEV